MPQPEIEAEKAAIYARVSSPNQKYNFSIQAQVDLCKKLCKERGWEIKYLFIDEAESAKNLDRAKFPIMMKKAEQGLYDILVMWKLDRLCRSLADTVNTERRLRRHNVNMCSVTEYIDTTTPVGRFNFRSLASVAEFERELIGERSRMGLYALAKQHKWPNKFPPYGYNKNKEGKLTINPDESQTVKQLFTEYQKIKSMPQLAHNLNQKNEKTKKGNPWSTYAIRKILTNKLYKHLEEYRIITDTQYEKVQHMRLRFKRGRGKKPKVNKSRRRTKIDKMVNQFSEIIEQMEMHTDA